VRALALPGGANITNSFDNVSRLTSTWLKTSGGADLDSYVYTYNQANQRTAVARTAGDFVNYTYDNAGELKTAIGKETGGVTNRWQEQFGYAYDAAGNLNFRTNNTLLQQFYLNSLNELTGATNSGRLTVVGSTTSPATNVTVNTSNTVLYADVSFASTNQPWVNDNNTYTAIAHDVYNRWATNSLSVNLSATNGFAYDWNGNLLSDGTRNFAYDNENQLIAVWVASSFSNNFVYDGKLRRRLTKEFSWNGSAWTQTNEVHFIYDGNIVVQERDANNLPWVTYTRGNDLSGTLQRTGGIGGLLARTANPQFPTFATALYHSDGNGNVTCLVYTNQTVAAKYLYDPFGNTLAQYGSLAEANVYRLSSKEWSSKARLYYYLYRFYDPNLGRWLNRDPIQEAGGLNLYDYVGNDPVDFVDTDGLIAFRPTGPVYPPPMGPTPPRPGTGFNAPPPPASYSAPNPSGMGTISFDSGVSFFAVGGGGAGTQIIRLDNGQIVSYGYVAIGAGAGFGKAKGGGGSAGCGKVYNVYKPTDYENGFSNFSIGAGAGVSISGQPWFGQNGAASVTGGFSTPGVSGTWQWYWIISASNPTN
jgi:RHS repeat-associated protein